MSVLLSLLLACAADPPSTAAPPPAPEPAPVAVVDAPAPPPAPASPPAIDLAIPRDAHLLVQRLQDAERRIRDPQVDDATAAALGHLQQRIYRTLADDPVLAAAVTAGVDPELRPWVEKNVAGTRAIARTVARPKTDLPPWRIVEPIPAAELLGYYKEAEQKHGVPWSVLASIHLNETRTGRLRGVSDAGARGPMQFMPATWKAYGEGDIESDRDAILAAGNYLAKMGWAKDRRKAVWHYNHHDAYVDAVLAYADVMAADERAFRGYWGWQVYYRTVAGSIWLSTGYESADRQPIEAWCAERGEPWCPKVH